MIEIGEEKEVKANILVIEDEASINQLLCELLIEAGYEVKSAYSGTEGKLRLEMEPFDLIMMDLMLPGMTGEELIKEVRKLKVMPIIVVSAKIGMDTRIEVLKSGADDFIAKPFNNEEVIARVEAQLRRYQVFSHSEQKKSILEYKNLKLDLDTFKAYVKGKEVELTAREFKILKTLMLQPKKVFTRANLFESVWEEVYMGDDNTINVHISNIRSKLGKTDSTQDYIDTVWGIGFKLSE